MVLKIACMPSWGKFWTKRFKKKKPKGNCYFFSQPPATTGTPNKALLGKKKSSGLSSWRENMFTFEYFNDDLNT